MLALSWKTIIYIPQDIEVLTKLLISSLNKWSSISLNLSLYESLCKYIGKDDKLLSTLILKNINYIKYISFYDQKNLDKNIILKSINKYKNKHYINQEPILQYLHKCFHNKEIIMNVIEINNDNYFYTLPELKNDIDIIVKTINYIPNYSNNNNNNSIIIYLSNIKYKIKNILNETIYKNLDIDNLPKEIIYAYCNKLNNNII